MSFSRAKLQRFNEIPNFSPSPADYNPIQKQRTWSVVSVSSANNDRFSDHGSVISNDSSVFRTPNLIRKKKPSVPIKTSSVKLFSTDKEILEAKIVECNNKDAYINDLAEQIEELKTQISNLHQQKIDLEAEKCKYETNLVDVKRQHEQDLENLKSIQSENLNSLRSRLRKRSEEFTSLKDEYGRIKEEQKATLEGLLMDLNQMGQEFNVKATEIYTAEIVSKENKIKEKEIEIEKIAEEVRILEKNNIEEIKIIKDLHKTEISNIEEEMLKIITSCEKSLDELKSLHESNIKEIEKDQKIEITKLKKDHSDLIKSLMDQKIIDLQKLEEDYQLKKQQVEIETKDIIQQTENIWIDTLKEEQEKANETLKTFQQESESKIIEIELEKNKLKHELSDLKYQLNELQKLNITEEKFKQLQIDYETELKLLKSKCADLESQKETLEYEVTQLVNTSHSYEITLEKTRETVNAISKRLLNSDRDVETLKKEVEIREKKCLDLEEECNRCQDKIENLIKINAELEENQEKFIADYNEEIATVKKDYESKVKSYKNLVDETKLKNEDLLSQKTKCLQENKKALDLQQSLNKEAHNKIENVNKKIIDLELVNINLKEEDDRLIDDLKAKKEIVKTLLVENEKLDEKLNDKIDENDVLKRECVTNVNGNDIIKLKEQVFQLQEQCESLQNYSEYYKLKVDEYEKEIQDAELINKNYNEQRKKFEDLQKRYCLLQEVNNKLKEKIEEYDNLIGPYREQLEAFEEERKHLISHKTNAETKYAEILGHQNMKQKIKHMVDLKNKIQYLEKANKDLEAKVCKQSKTIQQLKRDQAKSPKNNDKENNLNSPRDCYLSPFRDRN